MDLSFWRSRMSEEDLKPFIKAGFASRIGFGQKIALLNVDTTYIFHDPHYGIAYGDLSKTLESITILTRACREKKIPIFYSRRSSRTHYIDRGLWSEKCKYMASPESYTDPRADQWPPEFAPREEDVIIYKDKMSSFFGTPLVSKLIYIGVDTLIIVGISTSGCVRQAATDAFSYNIRPIVPLECAGDRCTSAHWANLFDMDMKFADVLPLEEVLDHLRKM